MAEVSAISWTDSTFNPWIGCTKVSPGCDHCYAEALDKRHRWRKAEHWGVGVPRMRTSESNWKQPLVWNKKALELGERWLVFCASLADVFDNEVPEQWRQDLWKLIYETPHLTWLLLTKRIGNAAKMLPMTASTKWGAVFMPNVWLGASVVNQEEADRDIPKLLMVPAAKRFVSYEPALGPVDFSAWIYGDNVRGGKLSWIIVGGESSQGGARARPFHLAWARAVIAQCRAAGVAVFLKQIGSRPQSTPEEARDYGMMLRDRAGANPAEWPSDLRVQEFPV